MGSPHGHGNPHLAYFFFAGRGSLRCHLKRPEFLRGLGQRLVVLNRPGLGPPFRTSDALGELGIWLEKTKLGWKKPLSLPWSIEVHLVREHKEATDKTLPLHGEKSMHRSWRMTQIPQAMQPQDSFINPNRPHLSPRDMESIEWFGLLLEHSGDTWLVMLRLAKSTVAMLSFGLQWASMIS